MPHKIKYQLLWPHIIYIIMVSSPRGFKSERLSQPKKSSKKAYYKTWPGLASNLAWPQFLAQNILAWFKSWPGLKFGLLNNWLFFIMSTCQIIMLLSVWYYLGKNTYLRFIFLQIKNKDLTSHHEMAEIYHYSM